MKLSIGTITHFAGNFVPRGWFPCDGRKFAHYQNQEWMLWTVLEARPEIKRDQLNFWLPNFPVDMGLEVPIPRQIIMKEGHFPPDFDENSDFYGLITTIEANEAVPNNWALCDGCLLTVESKNNALFSILSTTYGGDGKTTFALPQMADLGTKRYIICVNGMYPGRT